MACFGLVFVVGVKYRVKILFPLNNFYYSIMVRFDFVNHLKNLS